MRPESRHADENSKEYSSVNPLLLDTIRSKLRNAVVRGRKLPSEEGKAVTVREFIGRWIPDCFDGLIVEDLEYRSEEQSCQGWVPLRICYLPRQCNVACSKQINDSEVNTSLVKHTNPLPVVLLLHKTRSDLQWYAEEQASYARRGYMAVTIDCRYHGERSKSDCSYQEAIFKAWKGNGERPFLLDNVFDILCLIDYLVHQREDADSDRIGIYGYSLGGMHGWLSMALDERIKVAALIGGVQWFQYDMENNMFQGRVDSLPEFFSAAAKEMGKGVTSENVSPESGVRVDASVVQEAWHRLLPGLIDGDHGYDAPNSLQLIIPRHMLILQGDQDECCSLAGIHGALSYALKMRGVKQSTIKLFIEGGVKHTLTPKLISEAAKYLDSILKPQISI